MSDAIQWTSVPNKNLSFLAEFLEEYCGHILTIVPCWQLNIVAQNMVFGAQVVPLKLWHGAENGRALLSGRASPVSRSASFHPADISPLWEMAGLHRGHSVWP